MARIRTIKPEFFLHEGMADLPPLTRLVFIGLLCQADRAGRLEDRPKRLRAAILPYDAAADCEAILAELAGAGFITRYAVGDRRLIQIRGFTRHQRPHVKEALSELPEPPVTTAATTSPAPEQEIGTTLPGPTTNSPVVGPPGMEGVLENEGKEGSAREGKPAASAAGLDTRRRRGRPPAPRHPAAAGMCDFLAEQAREWKPDVRVDATSKRSLDGMDGLLRLDGRDPDKVRCVLRWLFTGGYEPKPDYDWRVNVLSGNSLRKHWDRLEVLHDAEASSEEGEWTGR